MDAGGAERDIRKVGRLLDNFVGRCVPPVGLEIGTGRGWVGLGSGQEIGGQTEALHLHVEFARGARRIVGELVGESGVE